MNLILSNEDKKRVHDEYVHALAWYKNFHDDIVLTDRKLFELKLGLGGLILIIFSAVFPHADRQLKHGFIIIILCLALLLMEEIWIEAREKKENLLKQAKRLILLKVRETVSKNPEFNKHGIEAERIYEGDDVFLEDMRAGKSLQYILDKHLSWESQRKYKFRLALYFTLSLVVSTFLFF